MTRRDDSPRFELWEGFFTYDPYPAGRVDWHLNFADAELFFAYGSSLLAQDEMQVAEHPALASLRLAVLQAGLKALTVEDGSATPVLIMGVERRCHIATDVNPAEGRPNGLYGNRFSIAAEDVIHRATEIIDPATISNILAMEAPSCGQGRYTKGQIEVVFATAFTGFTAAVFESKERVSLNVKTAIHTGFWGCGAYGGNLQLMSLLQMIAACASGLNTFVFHSGKDGTEYRKAVTTFEEVLPVGQEVGLDELLSEIEGMGYRWGLSNGT